MPHNWQSMDFVDTLDKWEQTCHAFSNQNRGATRASMQRWRKKLKQFVPGYPTYALILIKENESEEIIAISNHVEDYGIADLPIGWHLALKKIHTNPTIRIIEIDFKQVSMYEVRSGNPILSMDYQLDKRPRYDLIRYFIAALIRIYRNDPGPILIRSHSNGIMELDCWLLSNYFSISEYWKMDNESVQRWWGQLQKKNYDKACIDQWASDIIGKKKNQVQKAKNEMLISDTMNCNRAKGLIIPRNEISYNLSIQTIKQIIKQNIKIIVADIDELGILM